MRYPFAPMLVVTHTLTRYVHVFRRIQHLHDDLWMFCDAIPWRDPVDGGLFFLRATPSPLGPRSWPLVAYTTTIEYLTQGVPTLYVSLELLRPHRALYDRLRDAFWRALPRRDLDTNMVLSYLYDQLRLPSPIVDESLSTFRRRGILPYHTTLPTVTYDGPTLYVFLKSGHRLALVDARVLVRTPTTSPSDRPYGYVVPYADDLLVTVGESRVSLLVPRT